MYKSTIIVLALLGSAYLSSAMAESGKYQLDPGHSQVMFSYNHIGFSKTFGMFSGFQGDIDFVEENIAASSVNVTIPVRSMITGWEQRSQHFLSEDFFNATEGDMVTFVSTDIEITGEDTFSITGELSMNGITKSVILESTLNKSAPYPFGPKKGTSTLGFSAQATLIRSDFNLGAFAPAVSDEIELIINIEALKDSN